VYTCSNCGGPTTREKQAVCPTCRTYFPGIHFPDHSTAGPGNFIHGCGCYHCQHEQLAWQLEQQMKLAVGVPSAQMEMVAAEPRQLDQATYLVCAGCKQSGAESVTSGLCRWCKLKVDCFLQYDPHDPVRLSSSYVFHPADCWCEPCNPPEPEPTEEEKRDRLYCDIHSLSYDDMSSVPKGGKIIRDWGFYDWRDRFEKTGDEYAKDRMESLWSEHVETHDEIEARKAEDAARYKQETQVRRAEHRNRVLFWSAALAFVGIAGAAGAAGIAGLPVLFMLLAWVCVIRNIVWRLRGANGMPGRRYSMDCTGKKNAVS
jgi:hypothetical protein